MSNQTNFLVIKTFKKYEKIISLYNNNSSTKRIQLLIQQQKNEENEIDENDLYKYIALAIIFLAALLFILVFFCILKLIYKKCCKNPKIKNRFIMSECCNCFACLCHKYTIENRFSLSKNVKYTIGGDEDVSLVTVNNKRLSLIESFKSFSLTRRNKDLLTHHGKNRLIIENKNNSNSENFNNKSSNLSIPYDLSLAKENFKDYDDIDFGFITNEIILTDSHLNSETSI